MKKYHHTFYVLIYFICELAALVALVSLNLQLGFLLILLNFFQIFVLFIMHHVFNGFWISFAPAIIALITEDYRNFTMHSAKLFPTQAKCLYQNIGKGGSVQTKDALCFLPQNTVNEKIFVFLYFWFISVTIIQVVSCLYLTSMMFSKYLRKRHLNIMCNSVFTYRYNDFYSKYSHCGLWFALRLIHKNLGPILFKDLLGDLINPEKTKEKVSDDDPLLKGIEPHILDIIKREVVVNIKDVKWERIVGLESAKQTIQEAIMLPLTSPQLFVGLRTIPKGILLFGPPGTGKTLIGKFYHFCNHFP